MTGQEIKVKSSGFTYRAIIEKGSLANIGRAARLLLPAGNALLVSDSNVFSLYGRQVIKALESEKWQVNSIQVQPGEQVKNLDNASRLYDAAVDAGLDRNSPVIALGGGVVGDLSGFVASTYLRGIPLIMIPTSLLAQVDSSVGGKVAVNHPRGKNLIGSIYPPCLVVIDPVVLETLPRRELYAGLAEVIKYGVIGNGDFFYWLENNMDKLLSGDNSSLEKAIAESVRAKARVVQADEYENDYRRVLNFGHTIGHALEAATNYSYYLHGEAVLVGMAAVVNLALQKGLIQKAEAERITALLKKMNFKKAPMDLTAEKVIDKLRQDKKRRQDDLIFVLPTGIGQTVIEPVNDEKLLKETVWQYLSQS
ncbi:MAG: 3-dehydroquinate synthase [Bacillota bacterium]